jgi:hypothetical protein
MMEGLVEQFSALDDPRCASKVGHQLVETFWQLRLVRLSLDYFEPARPRRATHTVATC